MKDYKKELSAHDYQRFFGNEGVWRNDNHPEEKGEMSTVSTVVLNATDVLKSGRHTRLKIRHVRGFHGKGFMPACLSRFGGSSSTGDVHYGTNQEAYDNAVVDGRKTVAEMDAKWDVDTEKMKKDHPDKEWDDYPDLDTIPEERASDIYKKLVNAKKTIPELKELWQHLGDTPVNDDGELDVPFLHFEKGTQREDIWHWFESCNPKFVCGDIMSGKQ